MKQIAVMLFLMLILTGRIWAQSFTDSNLPIVLIETDTDGNGNHLEIPDEPKVLGTMKIIYHPDGSRNYVTDQNNSEFLNYDGRIGIEIRGSSSQVLEKKPYGFTTLQSDNVTNNNVSLLGMPSENDWILNSLAFDNSLMRNYLSYDLCRSIGEYAARGEYCEVVINGNYTGLYILMEKIKIDKNRVNIVEMSNTDNSNPDLTGGYLVKADKTTGGDPVAWWMESYTGGVDYLYDDPNSNDITPQQGNYIENYFISLQSAATAQNTSISNGFPSMIDIPSFINYMIISEITSNADSYQYSTYFHKDRNGKLRAGPVWDYDLTYGNDLFFWGLDRSHTDVWQFDNGDNTGSKFWKDFYNNSTYKCYLANRWQSLTATGAALNINVINDKITGIADLISEAADREDQRWGTVGNFGSNVAFIRNWLNTRISWITNQLKNANTCTPPSLPSLVISKINFNPVDAQGIKGSDLEFIEITNNGSQMANLTGVYFSELGISYQFPANSTIGANEKIILASNSSAFQQMYGRAPFGQFTRNLSNSSQKLVLSDAWGNIIDFVEYSDDTPWFSEADGKGYFLELNDVALDNNLPENWTISSNLVLGVNDNLFSAAMKIFPNPAIDELTIESAENQVASYEIFDLNGKKLIAGTHNRSGLLNVNVAPLTSNTYLLKITYSNREISVTKFQKL
ncbi:MAG: CotH kinase family protein [Bacteroidales bacterium]